MSNNTNYWRMNMHPDGSETKELDTMQCLGKNLIGFYVGIHEAPDSMKVDTSHKPTDQFCHELKKDDIVLLMISNTPLALVKVEGEFRYAHNPSELDQWCYYTREVKILGYYRDYEKGLGDISRLVTSSTIQKVDRSKDGDFNSFMKEWMGILNL